MFGWYHWRRTRRDESRVSHSFFRLICLTIIAFSLLQVVPLVAIFGRIVFHHHWTFLTAYFAHPCSRIIFSAGAPVLYCNSSPTFGRFSIFLCIHILISRTDVVLNDEAHHRRMYIAFHVYKFTL